MPTATRAAPPVPSWLTAPQPLTLPAPGRRRRTSFVDRTLDDTSAVLRQTMGADDATPAGFLHRLDPRAKVVALLVLLVGFALVHSPVPLVVAYLALVGLAAAGRVPVLSYLRRVWLAVPLFTAVVVAPATLSVVVPGDVVVPLWTWDGTPEGLTRQGLTSAALVLGRVACSISAVLLLTLTTGWVRLLAALGGLGVPRMLVMVIAMAYRYVVVLAGTVDDMLTSRRARTLTTVRHDGSGRALLGASAGALVAKAHHLSDEVHQAMVARGYRGRSHTMQAERLRAADALTVAVAHAAVVALLVGDGALGR